jgi:hypothetical protein
LQNTEPVCRANICRDFRLKPANADLKGLSHEMELAFDDMHGQF